MTARRVVVKVVVEAPTLWDAYKMSREILKKVESVSIKYKGEIKCVETKITDEFKYRDFARKLLECVSE